MAFGAWTFTYGVTNVMSMVKELNAKPLRFKRKVDSLSAFMTGHELPDALRARVREYFLLLRRHRIGTEELADEAWVFQELPAHLQIAIVGKQQKLQRPQLLSGSRRNVALLL
eukprot:GHVT01034519.1.p1 GENE.GHVT01034519.1~~GHVT01034519.1.p1  ORF type:complete len:113 (+),score=19.95 GHVT01034519.1:655-993(+)